MTVIDDYERIRRALMPVECAYSHRSLSSLLQLRALFDWLVTVLC